MLAKLLVAFFLMALCVAIHAAGMVGAFRWVQVRLARGSRTFWHATWTLVRIAVWTVFVHLLQISVWAFHYRWDGALPDLALAFYFSAVTYTTTGYGDVVLPTDWRLVGGVEALTGILMCGLSTGLFLAVFTKIFLLNPKTSRAEGAAHSK